MAFFQDGYICLEQEFFLLEVFDFLVGACFNVRLHVLDLLVHGIAGSNKRLKWWSLVLDGKSGHGIRETCKLLVDGGDSRPRCTTRAVRV